MPIQDNDLFLIDDGGTPKKVTASNLLANCEGSYADKFLLINDNSDNSYKMKASNLKAKLAESTTRWMMVERGGVSYKAQNTTLAEYFASVSYWYNYMGGNQYSSTDYIEEVSVYDGHVYSFGYSRSLNSGGSYFSPIIIKKDMSGETIWKKYGPSGPGNNNAFIGGKAIGGYLYAIGYSMSTIGNRDPWLVKLDTDGNIEWQRSYGESGSTQSNSWYGVDVDSSGNIYTTGRYQEGSSYSQAILAKWNSSGTLQWQRRFNSPVNIYTSGYDVAVDTSGNPYMVGNGYCGPYTNRSTSGFIIKFNSSGSYQWGKYYENVDNDKYATISIDSSNRIFVGGIWQTDGYGKNALLLRYNTSGNLVWRRGFNANLNGGSGVSGGLSRPTQITGLAPDNSGNVYIGGLYDTKVGSVQPSIFAKVDSNGNLIWKTEILDTTIPATLHNVTLDVSDDGLVVGAGRQSSAGGAEYEGVNLHLPFDTALIGTYGDLTGSNDTTILWITSVPGSHGSISSSNIDTPPFITATASHTMQNIPSGYWVDVLQTLDIS